MYRKKRWLIPYDISSDKIRTKVRKILTNFGFRIQYSVYLCELDKKQKKELTQKISGIIQTKDSIIWIPLSDQLMNSIEVQGKSSLEIVKASPRIL